VLESLRYVLDPIQSGLIPAHVTLCREDELVHLEPDVLASRLADSPERSLTLHFGRAEPFHEHGILLPCISGEHEFHSLREHVLSSRSIKRQSPHITLAHPRNPKAVGNTLRNAHMLPEVVAVTFTSANLIQQTGGSVWRILGTFGFQSIQAERSA
jgi:hypothetical protein